VLEVRKRKFRLPRFVAHNTGVTQMNNILVASKTLAQSPPGGVAHAGASAETDRQQVGNMLPALQNLKILYRDDRTGAIEFAEKAATHRVASQAPGDATPLGDASLGPAGAGVVWQPSRTIHCPRQNIVGRKKQSPRGVSKCLSFP